MSKIKELPSLERPREKGLRYGVNTLSDVELLSILLGSGYQGENVREIANNVLEHYQGIYGLSKCTEKDLVQFKGIKKNKAILLLSVFELHKRLLIKESETAETKVDAEYLYRKYWPRVKDNNQEIIILILVNRINRIIFETTLYKGTGNDVPFSYKEIWRELAIHQAHAFYLIHTHPHNESRPSRQDMIFTIEIFKEGDRIKTPLLDHIIIGDDGYYSFKNSKKYNISC